MKKMSKLNTMDSFFKGFKIERDGKVYTLTPEEMSDFRYLDMAITGQNCLEWYANCLEDADEIKFVESLMGDEELCYNIGDSYEDALCNDAGEIEYDIAKHYVDINKENMKHETVA